MNKNVKLNLDLIKNEVQKIRDLKPRIHMIPNIVTATLCADALSAVGARPIMAMYAEELEDVIQQADGFVANLGQLDEDKIKSVHRGIIAANERGIPIVIDPVGCCATEFRKRFVKDILRYDFTGIIKGNYAEISSILNGESIKTGVDSQLQAEDFDKLLNNYIQKSREDIDDNDNNKDKRVYIATGETDYILIKKTAKGTGMIGTSMLDIRTSESEMIDDKATALTLRWNVTGTGCMYGALLGAVYAVNPKEPEKAALVTSMLMRYLLANADNTRGYATYKNSLLDTLSLV
ncbi:hydroxyethylthiazole kinase [Falcatimonas sp. MSJ-15]|uniref:hydroxyethylthiazole kinase n=1 Tax=Falcatimonas sp. MSJ-15 TaxID=2841515 RepID=UPI001C0FF313|nr:hydroxyethylthiazole kinase [Falcatimonas sp. MSJ-15]MBU5469215.1 hydroxyethylthiazole kinase [Falcatimonas sp. MSJ-15]